MNDDYLLYVFFSSSSSKLIRFYCSLLDIFVSSSSSSYQNQTSQLRYHEFSVGLVHEYFIITW